MVCYQSSSSPHRQTWGGCFSITKEDLTRESRRTFSPSASSGRMFILVSWKIQVQRQTRIQIQKKVKCSQQIQCILYTNTNAQVHAVKVDLAWDVQTLVNHLQLPNLLPIQPDDLGQVFAPGIEHNNNNKFIYSLRPKVDVNLPMLEALSLNQKKGFMIILYY